MTSNRNLPRVLMPSLALMFLLAMMMGFTLTARSSSDREGSDSADNDSSLFDSGQQNRNTNRKRPQKPQKPGSTNKEIDDDGDLPDDYKPSPSPVYLEVSTPPALTTCSLGSAADVTSIKLDFGRAGAASVRVIVSDPVSMNEHRTVFALTHNGQVYQYHTDLNDKSTSVSLKLPQGMILRVGDAVAVTAQEQYTTSSANGCRTESLLSNRISFSPQFETNPTKLYNSSADESPGCHGQGIKFDGAFFFSSCQEKNNNNNAMAYIHDVTGTRLCSYTLGDTYDHPGGLVIYPGETGTAYLGFSNHAGNNSGQPIKISYDYTARRCRPLFELNKGAEVNSSFGFATRIPADQCKKDTSWSDEIVFYDDSTTYYTKCKKGGDKCAATVDIEGPTNPLNSSQDCSYYWSGAWFKVCISFSNNNNFVQIFAAKSLTLDEDAALATFPLNVGLRSGGMDIYVPPSGSSSSYLIISPHASGGNCGGMQPCTSWDPAKAQMVEVYNFSKWTWPSNSSHKICP